MKEMKFKIGNFYQTSRGKFYGYLEEKGIKGVRYELTPEKGKFNAKGEPLWVLNITYSK